MMRDRDVALIQVCSYLFATASGTASGSPQPPSPTYHYTDMYTYHSSDIDPIIRVCNLGIS